jgi:hypothetical protein
VNKLRSQAKIERQDKPAAAATPAPAAPAPAAAPAAGPTKK